MIRRHFVFDCEGSELIGTLDQVPGDHAQGQTGLLIVSGGNEVRAGAWNGQALLATRIAAAGYPVMRFDRRGIGDSTGPNGGFRTSAPDIDAALTAFRAQAPQVSRIVGFGNCDAASALMLTGGYRLDGLVLSNPWTIEPEQDGPPPEVLRSHYARRLKDPAALLRVLKGKVSLRALLGSLGDALKPAPPPGSLLQDMAAGLAGFTGPVHILLADRDRTALTFAAAWDKSDKRVHRCAGASHSFVEPDARKWLDGQLLSALAG